MRDPRLTTLAEPLLETSEWFPGQFAGRPVRLLPPNAVEVALNQAHDNFIRQIGYNHRLFRFIEAENERINRFRNWLIGLGTAFGIALAFTILVVVLRY